jgi:hypothetical protein
MGKIRPEVCLVAVKEAHNRVSYIYMAAVSTIRDIMLDSRDKNIPIKEMSIQSGSFIQDGVV